MTPPGRVMVPGEFYTPAPTGTGRCLPHGSSRYRVPGWDGTTGTVWTLPCAFPGCQVPHPFFLVRLLMFPRRDRSWAPVAVTLSLIREEEAESAWVRSRQSFGNNCHIPLEKGPIRWDRVFFFGVFSGPRMNPTEAERLASSEQPWCWGWGGFLSQRSGQQSQRGISTTDKGKGERGGSSGQATRQVAITSNL